MGGGTMCQPYFIINKKFVNTNWEAKVPPYFIINKKFVNTNWGSKVRPYFIINKKFVDTNGGGTMCHLPVLLKEEM